ncbi:MAG TPA: DUF2254 domain-containing protein [Jiangellales bacterium]|nr:DUF2254 domain-containing protein [Jiangellales bacterium]
MDPGPARDRLQSAFWLWPAVGVAAGATLGSVLGALPSLPDALTDRFGWPGGADSAQETLAVLAGAVMTVTSLSFSLTVISLQLASSQFSPRLLRTFAQDRVVRGTLAAFLGTFAYCLAVLRVISGTDEEPPETAMVVALVLGLTVMFALVGFVAHIVRMLRVDSMMAGASSEAKRLVRAAYPPAGASQPIRPRPPDDAPLLRAPATGVVQSVTGSKLVDAATASDLHVRIDVVPGDHVVQSVPVGRVWPRRSGDGRIDSGRVAAALRAALRVGAERTAAEDVGFAFRQLADIGVKAMSTGVNDPTTAVSAVGHLTGCLSLLTQREVVDRVLVDGDGVPRVVLAQRDFDYFVDLACAELRRSSSDEPSVLVALLGLLRDVAACSRTEDQRAAVRREVDLVVRAARRDVADQADLEAVLDAAWSAREALDGRWVVPGEPRPRAGESVSP